LVDGALGMAYGVTSTTLLMTLGVPPAAASASVHTAEIFTTGASGFSHLVFKNIDRQLFKKLVLPGILGAALGAYLLTFLPVWPVQFLVAFYLAGMGAIIVRRAVRRIVRSEPMAGKVNLLGVVGGFFDAMGGGGWGPIVTSTSTLVARGGNPRFAIGTVNLAEFFVALAASLTFLLTIGLGFWRIILGLIIGGVTAAPLAALLCRKIPSRLLMLGLGLLIILLSLRAAVHALIRFL
jgi:uncharacterized protein